MNLYQLTIRENIKKLSKIFFIIILTIFLSVTLIKGSNKIFKGIQGQDFPYSPVKLFWEGTNVYDYVINKKDQFTTNKKIILSQNGEYGQIFYLIFYPFTLTDFENAKKIWTILNFLFLILLTILLGRYLKLKNTEIFIAILLFISSYPLRTTINNGQVSLFTLLLFCLPFIFKSSWASFLSGIAYAKYNLGITLFFYSLINFKRLYFSLIPSFIGWLFYCYYTNTNLIKNIFEPLQAALLTTARPETIFQFISYYGFIKTLDYANLIILGLEILVCFILVFTINRNIMDHFYKLALITLTSITFFPHWGHDYVFLLPLALISWKNFDNQLGKINFIFIIYFIYLHGYVTKFLYFININLPSDFVQSMLPKLFFFLLLINLFLFKKFKFTN
jgi:hypothetical protein